MYVTLWPYLKKKFRESQIHIQKLHSPTKKPPAYQQKTHSMEGVMYFSTAISPCGPTHFAD